MNTLRNVAYVALFIFITASAPKQTEHCDFLLKLFVSLFVTCT